MSTKWDNRFMKLALEARSWVKGPDLGVGACVVSPDKRGFSLGYSGLPRGIKDKQERIVKPEYKDFNMVHAELNAILNASRSLVGWTMYSTTCPCAQCAAAIIQAGIVQVVSPKVQAESRWHHSQLMGSSLLREAGVAVRRMSLEDL